MLLTCYYNKSFIEYFFLERTQVQGRYLAVDSPSSRAIPIPTLFDFSSLSTAFYEALASSNYFIFPYVFLHISIFSISTKYFKALQGWEQRDRLVTLVHGSSYKIATLSQNNTSGSAESTLKSSCILRCFWNENDVKTLRHNRRNMFRDNRCIFAVSNPLMKHQKHL